jgi:predicted DNA-binding protein (UPF0278 family)
MNEDSLTEALWSEVLQRMRDGYQRALDSGQLDEEQEQEVRAWIQEVDEVLRPAG